MIIDDDEELRSVLSHLGRSRDQERTRLQKIRSYLRGDEPHGVYVPDECRAEYRMLVDQARYDVTRLLVRVPAQSLFVDGYRRQADTGRPEDADHSVWGSVWQPNRMDARQAGVHRAALAYAASYVTVLPATPNPVLTPYSPWRCTALYDDPANDLWPEVALTVERPDASMVDVVDQVAQQLIGPIKARVWDSEAVWDLTWQGEVKDVRRSEHGLGVCPVVRFWAADDLDGESYGVVEPMLPLQRQLNQVTFSLLMAQQFGAFRQRWATGMVIEEDDQGNSVSPYISAVDQLWQNESADGKFGEFSETPLSGYLDSRDKTVLQVAASAQIPPHNMLVGSGVTNISAEALAALQHGHKLHVGELQTAFGECWEQVLRLGAKAMGDTDTWDDTSAQVHWRDTEPRSVAQVADALGKLATMLGVPVQALWERIPDVTDQDLERWRTLAAQDDVVSELRGMLDAEANEAEADPGAVDVGV